MSNPRIFVTTDIGGGDKDDDQSLVHLLLYGDKLDIEGIGSAAPGPGRAVDIHQVIDAYAKDYSKLATYSKDYPTAEYLRSIVSQGAVDLAPKAGFSSATATSKAIIAAARAGSEADPLYVLTWGGIGDVAQALHDAPDIASKIRILSIGINQQDVNAGRYMMETWKGKVWWVDSQTTFRGMYAPESGTNTPITGWSAANAKGHGALGDYFEAHSYDLYDDPAGSQTHGLKMGDTPTVLYLLDKASNDDPTADSWGGEFVQKGANYWTDDSDSSLAFGNWHGARTVAEHRQEFLADFAVRLDRAKAAAPASTPTTAPPPAPTLPVSGRILVGTTEVETLSLSGFTVEKHGLASAGQWVKTTGNGTASGVFGGADGVHKVTVAYLDEGDGVSAMSLSVNGRVVKSWSATTNDDKVHSQSVQVSLKTGDTISIKGAANVGEYSRIDQLVIEAVNSGATPAPTVPTPATNPTPTPVPISGQILVGTTEVEKLSLSGFTVEKHGKASDGYWVKTTGSGTASGMFGGADGIHKVTVAYLDEGDGVSPMSLTVNGRVVKAWSASANNEQVQSQSVQVSLKTDDTIALKGAADQGEYARLDWIKIEATGSGATPALAVPPPANNPPPVKGTVLPDADFDLFAFAGQSNANGHFFVRPGDGSGGPLGKSVFEAEVSEALDGPVTAINISISGSGSNQYADKELYWWDIAADKPSQLLVDAVSKMIKAEAGGKDIDGLIWAQGEDDARQAFGSQKDLVVERLTESTKDVFAYIRGQLNDPSLPIFVQELGAFPNDVPADRAAAIRTAQERIIADDPFTFLGSRTTDLSNHNADNVHYSNAEYGIIADRLAAGVVQVLAADATSNASSASGTDDTLVLHLSEDMFKGHAQFIASVDGKALGAPQSVTALHGLGQTQAFTFEGDFGPGTHDLAVSFLNDAYEGTSETDRNLFVDSVDVNGTHYAGATASLYSAGTWHFEFSTP